MIKTEKLSFSEMLRRELLSVCQAYAQSHGNTVFSTTAKLFV